MSETPTLEEELAEHARVVAVRASIEGAAVAAMDALQDIIADIQTLSAIPNSTINANPAPYIKQLGQRVEVLARVERRLIRYTFHRLDGED